MLPSKLVHHDTELAEGLTLPNVLKSLLRLGTRWSLGFDVLEIQVVADSVSVFGGAEMRQAWFEKQQRDGKDSCAAAHWALLGVGSWG